MAPAGWFTSNEPREVSEVELQPSIYTPRNDKKRILNFNGHSAIRPDVCYLSAVHSDTSASSTVNSEPPGSSLEDNSAGSGHHSRWFHQCPAGDHGAWGCRLKEGQEANSLINIFWNTLNWFKKEVKSCCSLLAERKVIYFWNIVYSCCDYHDDVISLQEIQNKQWKWGKSLPTIIQPQHAHYRKLRLVLKNVSVAAAFSPADKHWNMTVIDGHFPHHRF